MPSRFRAYILSLARCAMRVSSWLSEVGRTVLRSGEKSSH